MDKTIDKNIALNFIDKLYSNLQETGKKINQTLTFLIILCISIILCQLHCITISNNIPILGIKFSISNNYLSLVLCFIFYLIQLYMIELNNKESEIAKNLKDLYK